MEPVSPARSGMEIHYGLSGQSPGERRGNYYSFAAFKLIERHAYILYDSMYTNYKGAPPFTFVVVIGFFVMAKKACTLPVPMGANPTQVAESGCPQPRLMASPEILGMKRWRMQKKKKATADTARRARSIRPAVAVMPAVLSLWACAAHAGFVNEAAQEAVVAAPAPALSVAKAGPTAVAAALPITAAQPSAVIGEGLRVTQIGFHPADIAIPKGRGRNIAVSEMIPVIVPHDYHVEMGNVEPSLLVTWSGDLPWDTVLTNAVAPLPNVHVTFDWDKHMITLHRGDESATAPATASALAPAKGALVAALGVASLNADMASVPVTHFNLLGGESLEAQLRGWAKRAGWSVTWNTPDDWIVPHNSSYGSDFQEAINSVFTQLAEDGADVRADIWQGNKAVVVDKSGASQ